MARGMYCTIHLLEIIRLSDFSSPLFYPFLLGCSFSRCSDNGQSFAPIGLHKTDDASDWLLIKRHNLGKKGLPGVQAQK
jgi:hypothetical protein